MAFGTGTHPTTKMSLFALEQVLRGGETVLDGDRFRVLSIASSLGAKEIFRLLWLRWCGSSCGSGKYWAQPGNGKHPCSPRRFAWKAWRLRQMSSWPISWRISLSIWQRMLIVWSRTKVTWSWVALSRTNGTWCVSRLSQLDFPWNPHDPRGMECLCLQKTKDISGVIGG